MNETANAKEFQIALESNQMARNDWTREQLLVAFALYARIPFGKFHKHNPEIKHFAELLGRTTSALAMKLSNIASLDPAFRASGKKGLEGASKSDKKMWKEMEADWQQFVSEAERALNALGQSFKSEVDVLPKDFSARDKVVTTKMRVGQSFFRRAVLSAYYNKCCITGLAVPALLVASHIKPWSVDESNRLNPRNGLALSALHDKAFDLGVFTLDENLRVCVTRKLGSPKDEYFKQNLLVVEGKRIAFAGKFSPDPLFLDHHRNHIFEKTKPFKKA